MTPADVCTPESHEADKAAFAPTLVYHSDQYNDDGSHALINLHCVLCDSTVSTRPTDHQRAPGESRYASTNRRPTLAPLGESPGPDGQRTTTSIAPTAEGSPLVRGPASTPSRRIITQPAVDRAAVQLAADAAFGHQLEQDTHSDRVVAEQLGAAIARRHHLVEIAIFTENREPRVVAARKELCEVLREMDWSLPRIGRAIDRHHTSVLSLLRSDVNAHA